ncbi:Nn.00g041670.m01.CDS01 [Neocucurbitaria sp. VM-36]
MANYVDASTQTIWAGLTKLPSVRPDILFTAPDTTTPPDEMITDKSQTLDSSLSVADPPVATTLLERRMNRPGLVARISLPSSEIDDELLASPPPTQALLSPVPAANKLHAGHTPLIPRSLSPVQGDDEQSAKAQPLAEERIATPEHDIGLTGPLILPTNPVDGAADHIALDALDDELEKIAREQDRFSKLRDAPEPTPKGTAEEDLSLSRKGSSDSRISSNEVEVVDGVRLKSPPLNFGLPLGQAPRRRSEAEET